MDEIILLKHILLYAVNCGGFKFPLQCILTRLKIVSSIARIKNNFVLNDKILQSSQKGNNEIDATSPKL